MIKEENSFNLRNIEGDYKGKTKEELATELIKRKKRILEVEFLYTKAVDMLNQLEKDYQTIFQKITDIFCIISPNGKITFLNPAFSLITDWNRDEWIGRSFFQLFHPDDLPTVIKKFNQLAKRKELLSCRCRIYSKIKKRCLSIELILLPQIRDGKVVSILGVARNVEKRKKEKGNLKKTVGKLEEMINGIIHAISKIVEEKDPFTAGHQNRVSQLSCAIAKDMGLPKEQIEGIRIAALLHDIGKINIPTEILTKPGQWSDIEFNMIKKHPKIGYEILKNINFPWPIAKIVLQHHERMNGSGYPAGLVGEDILLEARIIGVADVVEAMSSHRPYRAALGLDIALEEILNNKGKLYDPNIVDICVKLFREKYFKFERKK